LVSERLAKKSLLSILLFRLSIFEVFKIIEVFSGIK